ncbi:hypothetical protein [Patiriisocius marinus]|uniref:DoxX family protein n=1 Tax=Patiriisocius marinus TaxID=1397112 RepID=A0A5J4J2L5_9FLAO|nr:hypothetical protein [Patiriisocius marinus]GER60278.1 hypothetical protein ULMA_23860 [Patiriisocius marinus]
MAKFKNVQFTVRVILGGIIMLHGIYRIFSIREYLDIVLIDYNQSINQELFIISASIFPFLEFFLGALLVFKIGVNKASLTALIITSIMAFGSVIDDVSITHLIYNTIVMSMLVCLLGIRYKLINSSESQINTLR